MAKSKKFSSEQMRTMRKHQQYLDKGQSPEAAQILRVGTELAIEKVFLKISEDVDFLSLYMRTLMFREILDKYWEKSEAHDILHKATSLFKVTLDWYSQGLTEIKPWVLDQNELDLLHDAMDIAADLQDYTSLRVQYNEYMSARDVVTSEVDQVNNFIDRKEFKALSVC